MSRPMNSGFLEKGTENAIFLISVGNGEISRKLKSRRFSPKDSQLKEAFRSPFFSRFFFPPITFAEVECGLVA